MWHARQVADERILSWDGSYNVRDLGGLPTHDGGTTRFGAVIRSESPAYLRPRGWEQLTRAGVRTTVDLRSSWEVEAGSYDAALPVVVERCWCPLEEGLLDDPEFASWAADGLLATALPFAPYLARWPDRVATALRAVGDAGPGGALVHCERGRDRTGLIALLLLSLADVPHEVIVADHLLTDQHLVETGVALGHVPLDGEAEVYAARDTDAETVLLALLAEVDVTDLLRTAGATADEVTALRARLTP